MGCGEVVGRLLVGAARPLLREGVVFGRSGGSDETMSWGVTAWRERGCRGEGWCACLLGGGSWVRWTEQWRAAAAEG